MKKNSPGTSIYRIGAVMAVVFMMILGGATDAAAGWTEIRDMLAKAEGLGKAQQEKIYRAAYEKSTAEVKRGSAGSNDYLWLAIAAGRVAQVAGNKEKITLSKVVKDNAEKAISLDKNNGTAYATLGGWHYYVADLSWMERNAAKLIYGTLPSASYEKAVEYLSKAISLGVAGMEIYYMRANAYDEMDRDQQAAADFRKIVSMQAKTPREKEMQAEARDELD